MVHLYPQVPAAENVQPLKAMLRSASSKIMAALLPPSSNKDFPKREATFSATYLPTLVDPVNETKSTLLSSTIFYPIFPSPTIKLKIPPGKLFLSNTSTMILVVATETKFVVSEPFQIIEFPVIIAKAAFQPKTALGKLKAEIIPTFPSGLQFSWITWFGLSDGIIYPLIDLLNPQAKSQISTNS